MARSIVPANVVISVFCTLLVAVFLGACASRPRTETFTLVYLKTGPTVDLPAQTRQEIFNGHMANIQRLAKEGQLLIAGPFNKPADRTWRGIFVLATPDRAAAEALVVTDPGIQSGVFVASYEPLIASPSLRQCVALDAARRALPPTDPPAPAIRAYTMIHAPDAKAAMAALSQSGHSGNIVWAGRIAHSTRGMFVVDALDPNAAREWLGSAAAGCAVDSWYSTDALVDLPPQARILP